MEQNKDKIDKSNCEKEIPASENIFLKEVKVGDEWEDQICEYEIINNCGVEKDGDYLVFVNEGGEIPSHVKTVGHRAFSRSNVKSIVFPASVEEVEESGCSDCPSLESLILNEGLKKIERKSFVRTGLKSLHIPSTVEEIGGGAFGDIELSIDPRNLKYEIRGKCLIEKQTKKVICGMKDSIIPNDIKVIGEWAFFGSSIESITIPKGVEAICDHAFMCLDLKSIELNEGLREIGWNAFEYTKIKRVKIPSTVEYIQPEAFDEIKFEVAEGNKKYCVKENCLVDKVENKIVIRGKNGRISKDVNHIGDRAFSLRTIKRLRLPNSIKSIGESAFANCMKLRKIALNDGLKKIGEMAFSGLGVKSIVVPSRVEIIEESAFACGDNLKTIYCRAESKPSGWDDKWNSSDFADESYEVVWGYKGK